MEENGTEKGGEVALHENPLTHAPVPKTVSPPEGVGKTNSEEQAVERNYGPPKE